MYDRMIFTTIVQKLNRGQCRQQAVYCFRLEFSLFLSFFQEKERKTMNRITRVFCNRVYLEEVTACLNDKPTNSNQLTTKLETILLSSVSKRLEKKITHSPNSPQSPPLIHLDQEGYLSQQEIYLLAR